MSTLISFSSLPMSMSESPVLNVVFLSFHVRTSSFACFVEVLCRNFQFCRFFRRFHVKTSSFTYHFKTWQLYTQNHTNRQHHANNQVNSTRFTTITIQWHLGMLMQPISINVIANLPKYALNKVMCTIHRTTIKAGNQPTFRTHKQIEYEWSPKGTSFQGVTTFFPRVYVEYVSLSTD